MQSDMLGNMRLTDGRSEGAEGTGEGHSPALELNDGQSLLHHAYRVRSTWLVFRTRVHCAS